MLLSEIDAHRTQLTVITGRAVEDVTAYTRSVGVESPERAAKQLREASVAIVGEYGPVAAEGAALFYETQRPKPGLAKVATASIGAALANDLGFAFLPLFKPEQFDDPWMSLLSGIAGAVQRNVAAGDRETMLLSSADDPLSQGVRRFARPNACAFCAYLTSVIDVVDDDVIWHKNCHCVPVPSWQDNPLPHSPDNERWAASAERARKELERLQFEEKPADMRWRNFFKERPDLAINTKNITRLMRADLGLSH